MDIGEFDYFGPGPVRKKTYASYFYQRTFNGGNSLHRRLEKPRLGVEVTREQCPLKAVATTRAIGTKKEVVFLEPRSQDHGIAALETGGSHFQKPGSSFLLPPSDLLSTPPFSGPNRKPTAKGTKCTFWTSNPSITVQNI